MVAVSKTGWFADHRRGGIAHVLFMDGVITGVAVLVTVIGTRNGAAIIAAVIATIL